jgi:hypothetical protein
MKPAPAPKHPREELLSELLILPGGRLMAHNLTLEMARILKMFASADDSMEQRIPVRPAISSAKSS